MKQPQAGPRQYADYRTDLLFCKGGILLAATRPERKTLVSIQIEKELDVFEGNAGWEHRVFVKLYVAARTSGLLAEISDRDWKTLCTLATFMDQDGRCYPSQAKLARALGG